MARRAGRTAGVRGGTVALLAVLVAGAGCSAAPPAGTPGPEASLTVGAPGGGGATVLQAPLGVDHEALPQALHDLGIELADGTSIYAARILREPDGLRYKEFDAGGGAYANDFWPASVIKVIAAAGALEFLAGMGFTGAASVTTDEGTISVRELYESAIRDSSNLAYDWLVQIAGVDWLNTQFLIPRNGFVSTVIQRSYTGWGVTSSPPMTISEGDRSVELPAREAETTYPCPDDGNCSNLVELSDSIRRIVLADEIPAWERFVIADEDVAVLRQALLDADGFLEPGAASALGPDVLVYSKPGAAPDEDCVDVALVRGAEAQAEGYVLAITTPLDGRECATIAELAEVTLSFLQREQP